ncbi:MAG: SIMPL domain-containing protein [Pseudonocardia sp.]
MVLSRRADAGPRLIRSARLTAQVCHQGRTIGHDSWRRRFGWPSPSCLWRLGGFGLSPGDTSAARTQAGVNSVADARARAQQLAEAAGARLGPVRCPPRHRARRTRPCRPGGTPDPAGAWLPRQRGAVEDLDAWRCRVVG